MNFTDSMSSWVVDVRLLLTHQDIMRACVPRAGVGCDGPAGSQHGAGEAAQQVAELAQQRGRPPSSSIDLCGCSQCSWESRVHAQRHPV